MSEKNKTKVTLTNNFGEYSVLVDRVDLPLPDVIEDLLKPLMFAVGYGEKTVDECFNILR